MTNERARARVRAVEAACWAAVLALTAWSAWQRWEVLTLTPYPVGVDGWYYPIQVRALMERGELAYPASPLTFWLMWLVAQLGGGDPIVAAKVVAAGGGALVAVPAFLLGRRVGGLAGGLVAALLAVTGGGSFFLSLEFVKNGLGLTIGLTAAWLGLRALAAPAGQARGRIALAVAALVAAALTHKMSVLIAAVLLVPAVIVELRARGVAARTWRSVAIGGGVAVVLALAVGLLAPRRFPGPADLVLLDGAFTGPFEWKLPAMAVPQRGGTTTYHLWLGYQGVIAAAAGVAFAVVVGLARAGVRTGWGEVRAADRALVWAAFGLVVLTAWPSLAVTDPDALGFRLRVAVFAPASIVVAAAVGRGLAVLDEEWRLIVLLPLAAGWLSLRDARPTEGMVDTEIPMVSATAALRGALPPDAVIISAERHLGFQAAWFARVPVRLRPESVPPARRWRMIPLGIIGFKSPLDGALRAARSQPGLVPPIGLHPGHPNGLVVVPEATWEWVLGQLPPGAERWWREWHTL